MHSTSFWPRVFSRKFQHFLGHAIWLRSSSNSVGQLRPSTHLRLGRDFGHLFSEHRLNLSCRTKVPGWASRLFAAGPQRSLFFSVPALALHSVSAKAQSPVQQAWQPHKACPPHSFSWLLKELAQEVLICLRAVYLALLFLPAILTAPLVFRFGFGRQAWMQLILWTLERAGPAFIKWGQWATTRPDLFPPDLCHSLEKLQSSAPSHPGSQSLRIITSALKQDIKQLFYDFDKEPFASGSIAQLHKARLGPLAALQTNRPVGTLVAIKVRHPNVSTLMHQDFTLMMRAAQALKHIPGLSKFRLDESIRQFGGPLHDQLDLEKEAESLKVFNKNFSSWPYVRFPEPLEPLVSSEVLVETFEEGDLISKYVRAGHRPGPDVQHHMEQVANIGLNLYLQMVLKDNFVHADLHPGNILVSLPGHSTVQTSASSSHTSSLFASSSSLFSWRYWFQWVVPPMPKLVLLDTGMTVKLSEQDQKTLVEFFKALTKQDGKALGESILGLSECEKATKGEFVDSMKSLFDKLDPVTARTRTSEVFQQVMDVIREHQVTLKSTVSTVVVTTLVLEGWSSVLNPDIKILDTVRELLCVDWADRVVKTVDRVISSGALAVA